MKWHHVSWKQVLTYTVACGSADHPHSPSLTLSHPLSPSLTLSHPLSPSLCPNLTYRITIDITHVGAQITLSLSPSPSLTLTLSHAPSPPLSLSFIEPYYSDARKLNNIVTIIKLSKQLAIEKESNSSPITDRKVSGLQLTTLLNCLFLVYFLDKK